MKVLNIALALVLVTSIGWVAYDLSTRSSLTEKDYQAIRYASEKLQGLSQEVAEENTYVSYRHVHQQAFACNDDKGFQLLDKAKANRKATLDIYLANESTFAELAGRPANDSYEPSSETLDQLKTAVGNYINVTNNLFDEGTGKLYSPFPLKNRVSNEKIELSALSGEPVAIWQVVHQMIQSAILDAERVTITATAQRIFCEHVSNLPKVLFSNGSETMGRGETFEAEVFLGVPHFVYDIEVSEVDGNLTIGKNGVAILNIPASADSFDESGKATHTWKAKLKVPDLFEYKEVELKGEFQVKKG